MRTALLVFMMIGSIAWMQGTSYAASSKPLPQASSEGSSNSAASNPGDPAQAGQGEKQTSAGPSGGRQESRSVPVKTWPRSHASSTTSNRPKRVPNNRDHSSRSEMNFSQSRSTKFGGARTDGVVESESAHGALAVRAATVSRGTGPSLNTVRHRSPNPPIVGGSGNTNAKNAGALSGTRMNRKP
jgi:hypothetical protein